MNDREGKEGRTSERARGRRREGDRASGRGKREKKGKGRGERGKEEGRMRGRIRVGTRSHLCTMTLKSLSLATCHWTVALPCVCAASVTPFFPPGEAVGSVTRVQISTRSCVGSKLATPWRKTGGSSARDASGRRGEERGAPGRVGGGRKGLRGTPGSAPPAGGAETALPPKPARGHTPRGSMRCCVTHRTGGVATMNRIG